MTDISIIMPTFQNAKYIGRAIKSVLSQTYKEFELIIIDNYSQDKTQQIVESFKDSRIIYQKFSNEGIISKSRNLGLNLSKGKYIAFLDSDDWWHKGKLQACMSHKDDSFDIFYHKMKVIRANNHLNFSKIGRSPKFKNLHQSLLQQGNFIPNSSVIISRSAFNDIGNLSEDKNKVTWEDFDYWIRLSSKTNRFKFINKTLGYYWIGNENNTTPERTLRNVDNMKKILYFNNEQKLPSWLLYQRAISLFHINKRTESLKYLKYIFKNSDDMVLRLKALIRLMQYSF